MAELLTKEVLFDGKGELDQLQRIFALLGSPSEKTWPGLAKLPNVSNVRRRRRPPPPPARGSFSIIDWDAHKRSGALLSCKRLNDASKLRAREEECAQLSPFAGCRADHVPQAAVQQAAGQVPAAVGAERAAGSPDGRGVRPAGAAADPGPLPPHHRQGRPGPRLVPPAPPPPPPLPPTLSFPTTYHPSALRFSCARCAGVQYSFFVHRMMCTYRSESVDARDIPWPRADKLWRRSAARALTKSVSTKIAWHDRPGPSQKRTIFAWRSCAFLASRLGKQLQQHCAVASCDTVQASAEAAAPDAPQVQGASQGEG